MLAALSSNTGSLLILLASLVCWTQTLSPLVLAQTFSRVANVDTLEEFQAAFFNPSVGLIELSVDINLFGWNRPLYNLTRNITIQGQPGDRQFILDFNDTAKIIAIANGFSLILNDLQVEGLYPDGGSNVQAFASSGWGVGYLELVDSIDHRLACLPPGINYETFRDGSRPAGVPGLQRLETINDHSTCITEAGIANNTCFYEALLLDDVAQAALADGSLVVHFIRTVTVCDHYLGPDCLNKTGVQLEECWTQASNRQPGLPPAGPPSQSFSVSPPRSSLLAPPTDTIHTNAIDLKAVIIPTVSGSVLVFVLAVWVLLHLRKRHVQAGLAPKASVQDPFVITVVENYLKEHSSSSCMPAAGKLGGTTGNSSTLHSSPEHSAQRSQASQDESTHQAKNAFDPLGAPQGSQVVLVMGADSSRTQSGRTPSSSAVTSTSDGSSDLQRRRRLDACRLVSPSGSIMLFRLLGAGSFGRVYQGTWQGQAVAVKVVPHTEMAAPRVKNEVELCLRFEHPNVVRCLHYETFCVDLEQAPPVQNPAAAASPGSRARQGAPVQETWIVMDYADQGSLASRLQPLNPEPGGASSEVAAAADPLLANMHGILHVATHIARGIEYLHSLSICHGDLKCENVLLASSQSDSSEDGKPLAKVGDFGLSRAIGDVTSHLSTATLGTVTHMPPELLLSGQLRPSCDIFSFGIILWQLFTGATPYHGMRYAEIVYKVAVCNMRPLFPLNTPPAYRQLAEECWYTDPAVRPPISQVLQRLEAMLLVADELQAACSAGQGSGSGLPEWTLSEANEKCVADITLQSPWISFKHLPK